MTQRPSPERLEEIREQLRERHFGWPQELLAEIDALWAENAEIKKSLALEWTEITQLRTQLAQSEKKREKLREALKHIQPQGASWSNAYRIAEEALAEDEREKC